MTARLCAFVVWAAAAACAVFWGLRLGVAAPAAPAGVASVELTTAARGDLTRLFGAPPVQPVALAPAPPAESTRFRLSGVMAPRGNGGSHGVALVAIDGKPPKAYKVGARVEGELMLRSVSLRTATFATAADPTGFTLDLPLLPPPNTGTLPAPDFNLGAPPLMAPPGVQQQGMAPPMIDASQNGGDPESNAPPVAMPPMQLPPPSPLQRRNMTNQR